MSRTGHPIDTVGARCVDGELPTASVDNPLDNPPPSSRNAHRHRLSRGLPVSASTLDKFFALDVWSGFCAAASRL